MSEKINRREFLSKSAALGVAGVVGTSMLMSCNNGLKPLNPAGSYYIPKLADMADDGREIKVGLIGCGGRGNGAINNLLHAANGVKVIAAGDVFQDKLDQFVFNLKDAFGQEIPKENQFVGFDAYQKVIDCGVDAVVCTTPPVYRPVHFKYAVEKGIHCFLEKPVAVDPVGCREIIAAAKIAQSKGLSVVTGTQRHHQRPYVAAYQKIQEGYIGEIVSGNVYWNQGKLWHKNRVEGWSDMEWMIRDWVNWKWLSGDHIVEQHVHNIDVFMWMTGLTPIRATANGSRHRRITGDQYDNFSVDFEFENGVRLTSVCRQINACDGRVSELIYGTKGYWSSETSEIRDYKGNIIWKYDEEKAQAEFKQHDPYVLEHVDWINHIRAGEGHEEATQTALSTMAGVLGRESAYSGKILDYQELLASDLSYMLPQQELVNVDMTQFTVAVPGIERTDEN